MGTDEKNGAQAPTARVDDKFKIFCGTANEALADEVCAFLGLTRGQAHITRFKDGECYVQIRRTCAALTCSSCSRRAVRWTST